VIKLDRQCPYCGKIYPFKFRICPHCGKKYRKCPHCGYMPIIDDAWICPGCGKKFR